jgi:hypothetical protein
VDAMPTGSDAECHATERVLAGPSRARHLDRERRRRFRMAAESCVGVRRQRSADGSTGGRPGCARRRDRPCRAGAVASWQVARSSIARPTHRRSRQRRSASRWLHVQSHCAPGNRGTGGPIALPPFLPS